MTVVHSRTENAEEITREADIIISAVGQPNMVRGSWVKPGAVIIDVGINPVEVSFYFISFFVQLFTDLKRENCRKYQPTLLVYFIFTHNSDVLNFFFFTNNSNITVFYTNNSKCTYILVPIWVIMYFICYILLLLVKNVSTLLIKKCKCVAIKVYIIILCIIASYFHFV